MPLVFKTEEEYPATVQFVGVGVAPANGKGGVLVEEAAKAMTQLQSIGGVPLEGKELLDAAQRLANSVDGLTVADEKKVDLRAMAREAGALTVTDPPADQVARERYLRTYGHLDPELRIPDGQRREDSPEVIETGAGGEPHDQPRPDVQPVLGQGEDAPTNPDEPAGEPRRGRRSKKDGDS